MAGFGDMLSKKKPAPDRNTRKRTYGFVLNKPIDYSEYDEADRQHLLDFETYCLDELADSHIPLTEEDYEDFEITPESDSTQLQTYTGKVVDADVITKKFQEKFKAIMVDTVVFVYENNCYRKFSPELLNGMILKHFNAEINDSGNGYILRQLCEFFRARLTENSRNVVEDRDYIVYNDCRFNVRKQRFEDNGPDVIALSWVNVSIRSAGISCPVFDSFLEHVTGGDQALLTRFWQAIGYILSNDNRGMVFFALCGPTATGKSLFLKVIRTFFVQNETEITVGLNEMGKRFGLGSVTGVRLLSDPSFNDKCIETESLSVLKSITDGDNVRTEEKYEKKISTDPGCKVIVASNALPRPKTHDEAYEDRMILLPFPNQIERKDRDTQLFEKILPELPAIARRALDYYIELRENNYCFEEFDWESDTASDVREAVIESSVRANDDVLVQDYVFAHCRFDDDEQTLTSDLYEVFEAFCTDKGYTPLNIKDFSNRLHRLFPALCKCKIGSKNGYKGIALK